LVDGHFKSTFHRVKAPCEEDNYHGERYSIAFFNQPCKDAAIQGPQKKYPRVAGEEFTRSAMNRNFKAVQEKLMKEAQKKSISATLMESRRTVTAFA
jgi:isopenicillin N synthase-like dioxygenase